MKCPVRLLTKKDARRLLKWLFFNGSFRHCTHRSCFSRDSKNSDHVMAKDACAEISAVGERVSQFVCKLQFRPKVVGTLQLYRASSIPSNQC